MAAGENRSRRRGRGRGPGELRNRGDDAPHRRGQHDVARRESLSRSWGEGGRDGASGLDGVASNESTELQRQTRISPQSVGWRIR